jgi:DNA-binding GntR family transcriptional regulator
MSRNKEKVLNAIISRHRETEKPITEKYLIEKFGMHQSNMRAILQDLMSDESIKHHADWGYLPLVRDERVYKIINMAFRPVKEAV